MSLISSIVALVRMFKIEYGDKKREERIHYPNSYLILQEKENRPPTFSSSFSSSSRSINNSNKSSNSASNADNGGQSISTLNNNDNILRNSEFSKS